MRATTEDAIDYEQDIEGHLAKWLEAGASSPHIGRHDGDHDIREDSINSSQDNSEEEKTVQRNPFNLNEPSLTVSYAPSKGNLSSRNMLNTLQSPTKKATMMSLEPMFLAT